MKEKAKLNTWIKTEATVTEYDLEPEEDPNLIHAEMEKWE